MKLSQYNKKKHILSYSLSFALLNIAFGQVNAADLLNSLQVSGDGGTGYGFPSEVDRHSNLLLLGGGESGLNYLYDRSNSSEEWRLTRLFSPDESGRAGNLNEDWLVLSNDSQIRIYAATAKNGEPWGISAFISPTGLDWDSDQLLLVGDRLFVPYTNRSSDSFAEQGVLVYAYSDDRWQLSSVIAADQAIVGLAWWQERLVVADATGISVEAESSAGGNDWFNVDRLSMPLASIKTPVQADGPWLVIATDGQTQGRSYQLFADGDLDAPVQQILNPDSDNPTADTQYFSLSKQRLLIASRKTNKTNLSDPLSFSWIYQQNRNGFRAWGLESQIELPQSNVTLYQDEVYIGAPQTELVDEVPLLESGELNVWRYSNARWTHRQTIDSAPGAAGVQLGAVLVGTGNQIMVGAAPNPVLNHDGGALKIIEAAVDSSDLRDVQSINQVFDQDDDSFQAFGRKISVSDQRMVAALTDESLTTALPRHELRTFEQDDQGGWDEVESHRINLTQEQWGECVLTEAPVFALYQDLLAIDCPQQGGESQHKIYQWSDQQWSLIESYNVSFQSSVIDFRLGMLAFGDYAQVQSYQLDEQGKVTTIFEPMTQSYASLAVYDTYLYLGQPSQNRISVYHSDPIVSNAWVFDSQVMSINSSLTSFGATLNVQGDVLFIGEGYSHTDTRFDHVEIPKQISKVYVYKKQADEPQNWDFIEEIASPLNQADDGFGTAIFSFGHRLMIGAPGANGQYGRSSGQVFYFQQALSSNSPAELAARPVTQLAEQETIQFEIKLRDANGDPVELIDVILPSWLNLEGQMISGQAPSEPGEYQIIFVLTDGIEEVSRVLTLSVGSQANMIVPQGSETITQIDDGVTVISAPSSGGGAISVIFTVMLYLRRRQRH